MYHRRLPSFLTINKKYILISSTKTDSSFHFTETVAVNTNEFWCNATKGFKCRLNIKEFLNCPHQAYHLILLSGRADATWWHYLLIVPGGYRGFAEKSTRLLAGYDREPWKWKLHSFLPICSWRIVLELKSWAFRGTVSWNVRVLFSISGYTWTTNSDGF